MSMKRSHLGGFSGFGGQTGCDVFRGDLSLFGVKWWGLDLWPLALRSPCAVNQEQHL